jgi:endonuclease YncB( thermonuclease family)
VRRFAALVLYRRLTGGRGRPFDGRDLVRAGLALAGLALLAILVPRWAAPALTGGAIAIDGDSLRLNDRELRLAGIDAPELHQKCERNGQAYPCGREALSALVVKLRQGQLSCRVIDVDRYGRDVAQCTLDGRDLNADLVREGVALAYGHYEAQEAEARSARRGLWAGTFERPADWRRRHPRGDLN